jgi:hypothetical protein
VYCVLRANQAGMMLGSLNARVLAMELASVFRSSDLEAYRARAGVSLPSVCSGFAYSGSYAGRNIEKMYELGRLEGSLENAVRSCFDGGKVTHVLVTSGFYVLHNHGGNRADMHAGIQAGSCETDGPLGALALVRAFACRGVHVSLYCEPHNGPVLRAGYEAMLRFYSQAAPAMAARLQSHTRCLPEATDGAAGAASEEFTAAYAAIYPDDPKPSPASLRSRTVRSSWELGKALEAGWAPDGPPSRVDALFAIERLSAPYRNIRGRDIGAETEPIDALWPLAVAAEASAAAESVRAFTDESGSVPSAAVLRELAHIAPDAMSLGIGDGGNEVGMGKITCIDEISALSPGGEFAPIHVNGAHRACDHLVLGTVSNWAGTAFEAAAHVLFPENALDYGANAHATAVELALLDAIMAQPAGSVDGKYHEQPRSVDGLVWEPYHREFYETLWTLATQEEEGLPN